MTRRGRRPNIEYFGGPYSGQEDYRDPLPPTIPARDERVTGVYTRTGRVNKGHVVYEWRRDKPPVSDAE